MMLHSIKLAFETKKGKINLLLMVGCIVILLLLSNVTIGRFTYILYAIPACGFVIFGDQFVKIATYYMQQALDERDNIKK